MVGAFIVYGAWWSTAGYVVAENGCHIWVGDKNPRGYGRVYADGKKQYAHRVRYEREIGPVPAGLVLDHYVCSNTSCCNPRHVRPVTARENALRDNVHARKTHCPRGHEYVAGNLVARRDGSRECLVCATAYQRAYQKEYRAKLRAKCGHAPRRIPRDQ